MEFKAFYRNETNKLEMLGGCNSLNNIHYLRHALVCGVGGDKWLCSLMQQEGDKERLFLPLSLGPVALTGSFLSLSP